jgi:hypothetical protein
MHSKDCGWPSGQPCLAFSTDGTYLGAVIAHTMGTIDEREIAQAYDRQSESAFFSDVEAEQADWESDEDD